MILPATMLKMIFPPQIWKTFELAEVKMDKHDLPLGFSFALAQKPDAMTKFTNLPESKQSEILQRARAVSSKGEMQSLVNELSAQG